MLQDIDSTLRAVLTANLPEGTTVGFAAPDRTWRSDVDTGPALNAFLVRLTEDLGARGADWTTLYDENHHVVGRQEPTRRFRAHYVLTAWAADPEAEHALLGAALRVLVTSSTVPAHCLAGSLADLAGLVTLDVAHPDLPTFPVEAWSALGMAPRAGLDVVLTVPLVPDIDGDLPRPPDTIALDVAADVPARTTAPSAEPQRPRARITEGR